MSYGCCAPRTDCKQSFPIENESAGTTTLISSAAAAGRTYVVTWARIVQDADTGAAIVLKAGSSTILTVDPVTFEGVLESFQVNGESLSVVISGAGTASAAINVEWF